MLFSGRSIWTMIHGIGLGGGALLGLGAALFHLYALRAPEGDSRRPGAFAALNVFTAAMLWLAALVGTYILFPAYRAAPPAGLADLHEFPRARLMASPDTAWLHSFAMESKEHMPFVAAMLATAVAAIAVRSRSRGHSDASLRRMAGVLLAIAFVLVAFLSLMGVFVNKVAPLD